LDLLVGVTLGVALEYLNLVTWGASGELRRLFIDFTGVTS